MVIDIKRPVLLYKNDIQRIDYSSIKSLGIIELLEKYFDKDASDFIINNISYGVAFDKISLTQALFCDLQDTTNYNIFQSLFHSLLKLHNSFELLNGEKDEIYKHFYLLNCFSQFCDFAQKSSEAVEHFNSDLIKNYSDYFSTLCSSAEYEMMKRSLKSVFSSIEYGCAIKSKIFINGGTCSSELSRQSDDRSINSRLIEIAAELKMDEYITKTKSNIHHIKFSMEESAEVFKLLSDITGNIAEFYDLFKTAIDTELFNYIDQMRYFLYISDFYKHIKKENIPLHMPSVDKQTLSFSKAYDLTLLVKKKGDSIIPNDICYSEDRKIAMLSGANSGGKTTYLRAVGLCLMLAYSGGFVPCTKATVCDIAHIFVFDQTDEVEELSRFEYEAVRMNEIIQKCNSKSFLLSNEAFTSTDIDKSTACYEDIIKTAKDKRIFALFVTHNYVMLRKVLTENNAITSLVAQKSSYKILEVLPDFHSYSYEILKRHGMTQADLQKM